MVVVVLELKLVEVEADVEVVAPVVLKLIVEFMAFAGGSVVEGIEIVVVVNGVGLW